MGFQNHGMRCGRNGCPALEETLFSNDVSPDLGFSWTGEVFSWKSCMHSRIWKKGGAESRKIGFVDIIIFPGCFISPRESKQISSSGTTERKKACMHNASLAAILFFYVLFFFWLSSLFTAGDAGRALWWAAAYCARNPEYILAPFLSGDPGQ